MRNVILSYIRTYVPIWVATAVAFLASKGIDVDLDAATVVALGGVISGYYTVGRLLEANAKTAWLGRLLLSLNLVGAPEYGPSGGGQASSGGSPDPYGGV